MSLSSVHTKHVRRSISIRDDNQLIVSYTSAVAGRSTQEHCGAGDSGGLGREQMRDMSHFVVPVRLHRDIQATTTGS